MRPTREAFELSVAEFASDSSALDEALDYGDSDIHERRAAKAKSKRAVMAVYDAQEAQIRELADALEAVLDAFCCGEDGVCGLDYDSSHVRDAREVLKRARGES